VACVEGNAVLLLNGGVEVGLLSIDGLRDEFSLEKLIIVKIVKKTLVS